MRKDILAIAMDEAMDDMISFLDTIRHMLITISEELGVTDPASGVTATTGA